MCEGNRGKGPRPLTDKTDKSYDRQNISNGAGRTVAGVASSAEGIELLSAFLPTFSGRLRVRARAAAPAFGDILYTVREHRLHLFGGCRWAHNPHTQPARAK